MPLAPPYTSGNLAGVCVSRETWERLDDFAQCILKWSHTISLVSKAECDRLWQRHILDCAQLWPLRHPETRIWADLGTGAGLPGVVLAIMAHQLSPKVQFHLVESDQRKAAFIRFIESRQKLGLVIHTTRIEELPSIGAQTVSARALAPLPQLVELVAPHLLPGGYALLPKGHALSAELEQTRKNWILRMKQYSSKLDSGSSILQIHGMQRRA